MFSPLPCKTGASVLDAKLCQTRKKHQLACREGADPSRGQERAAFEVPLVLRAAVPQACIIDVALSGGELFIQHYLQGVVRGTKVLLRQMYRRRGRGEGRQGALTPYCQEATPQETLIRRGWSWLIFGLTDGEDSGMSCWLSVLVHVTTSAGAELGRQTLAGLELHHIGNEQFLVAEFHN